MKIKEEELFIKSIISYLKKCNIFNENASVNINYLGPKIDDYSLESVPTETILKKDIEGRKEKQKVFVFASRRTYSRDCIENEKNYEFFEELSEWIEEMNDEECYPDISNIDEISEISSIEVVDSPYIAAVSELEARYQMEIKITYIKE